MSHGIWGRMPVMAGHQQYPTSQVAFGRGPRQRYGTMGLGQHDPYAHARVHSVMADMGLSSVRGATGAIGALVGLGSEGDAANGNGEMPVARSWSDLTPRQKTWATIGSLLSFAGASTGAYHGYKRNGGSWGWGIGWFIMGSLFPVITIPVSLAQGFGKRSR